MADAKTINILAVDEREENLPAIARILEGMEINLVRAYSGNEALSLMTSDVDFVLVLLDLQMDGIETATRMRDNDKISHIPILFIGDINNEKQPYRGDNAGAVDYIFKPINPDVLRSKVDVFITLYRQQETLTDIKRELEQTNTELIISREQLKLGEEKYRGIFENANEGIFILKDKKIIFYNPKTTEILCGKSCNLQGKMFIDFVPPHFRQPMQHHHFDKVEHELYNQLTTTKILSGGDEMKWIEINTVNIQWEGAPALLNFISDVSKRKQAEEEIKKARKLAEQTIRTKSEFLANMSHEIRTPLNGIIGMTELALMGELEADQRERIEAVKFSGESLLDIINDILDLSKIEARKLELDSISFSLRGVIEKVMRPLSTKTAQKNLELILDIGQEVHDNYIGDPVRLRQILFNLLGNAIKFTEQGEVRLEVRMPEQQDEEATLHFAIHDTGIGIADDKLDNLFKSFSQADSTTSRKFGGTGLGLAISRNLVEMMNGHIEVESEPGKGSTFSFFIRLLKTVPARYSSDKVLPAVRQKKILVVDDNDTNRKIIYGLLRHLGIHSELAVNGKMAYDLIREKQHQKTPFDIMLLDYHMPDLDGLHLAKRLLAEKKDAPLPKIVLLSSDDVTLSRANLSKAGIERVLIKPIFINDLIKTLNELTDTSGLIKAKPVSTISEYRIPKGLAVLLVEDNLINQKLANGLLSNLGCNVTVANHGGEAVEILKQKNYDLIFMDIQMPEMDGFEATRVIREREQQTKLHAPIIAMTAHAMKGDREKCISAGMDDYVTKPISMKAVTDVINKLAPKNDKKQDQPPA
ncbi:MAG: response regulator [Clostridia bacterium]|nr:response regulator [Clostridia bacterium]